jgi:hypothetical protein
VSLHDINNDGECERESCVCYATSLDELHGHYVAIKGEIENGSWCQLFSPFSSLLLFVGLLTCLL